MTDSIDQDLKKVRDWAQEKIKGNEPPWVWYQCMKLIETVSTILDGMAAVELGLQPEFWKDGTL